MDARACFETWVEAYVSGVDCKADCSLKFAGSAVSGIDKGSVKPFMSPPRAALRKGIRFLVAVHTFVDYVAQGHWDCCTLYCQR